MYHLKFGLRADSARPGRSFSGLGLSCDSHGAALSGPGLRRGNWGVAQRPRAQLRRLTRSSVSTVSFTGCSNSGFSNSSDITSRFRAALLLLHPPDFQQRLHAQVKQFCRHKEVSAEQKPGYDHNARGLFTSFQEGRNYIAHLRAYIAQKRQTRSTCSLHRPQTP